MDAQLDKFDKLDWRILSILMADGRTSNVDIARQIGSSEGTVRRRIQHLIERGVMEIVAMVDPDSIGLGTQVIIGIDAEMSKGHQIAEALGALTPVRYVAYTAGRYDFIIEAYFTSEHALFEFLTDQVPNIPGIVNTETFRILKVSKHTWQYLPERIEERA